MSSKIEFLRFITQHKYLIKKTKAPKWGVPQELPSEFYIIMPDFIPFPHNSGNK